MKIKVIGCALVLVTGTVVAQKDHFGDAEYAYQSDRYYSATQLYKKAETKKKTVQKKGYINYKIGMCYLRMLALAQAEVYFRRSEKLKYGQQNPVLYYQLGKVLLEQGHYKEAMKVLQKYSGGVDQSNVDVALSSCEKALEWMAEPTRHIVEADHQLNSKNFDWSLAFVDRRKSTAIFSSTRVGSLGDELDENSGEPFNDLWTTTRDNNGKWSAPVPLTSSINTPDNEATAIVNAKGNRLYYTSCPRVKKTNCGCDIMVAEKQGNNWKKPTRIAFKPDGGDSISVGHPALTRDEKTMVFSANLPGGSGKKDLWVSRYNNKTKTWGIPKNLGPQINTEGDEKFPVIDANGNLYFSSNGKIGMGGLDLFWAEKTQNDTWENAENLGYPLNSHADDFGIVFEDKAQTRGYFTSSRAGGKGKDDLYLFHLPPLTFSLEVRVRNKKNLNPVSGAKVQLTSSTGELFELTTNENGTALFEEQNGVRYIQKEKTYNLEVLALDHFKANGSFATENRTQSVKFYEEIFIEEVVFGDHGETYDFPQVLYPYDQSILLIEDGVVDSRDSLDYLYNLLVEHPNWVIELQSHTDCRGPASYNRRLSNARAATCVQYLESKGIDPRRMVPQGYGEDVPLDGLECEAIQKMVTDEERKQAHQKNRRTQFKVLRTDF